jgi:chromosome segregation ATPase
MLQDARKGAAEPNPTPVSPGVPYKAQHDALAVELERLTNIIGRERKSYEDEVRALAKDRDEWGARHGALAPQLKGTREMLAIAKDTIAALRDERVALTARCESLITERLAAETQVMEQATDPDMLAFGWLWFALGWTADRDALRVFMQACRQQIQGELLKANAKIEAMSHVGSIRYEVTQTRCDLCNSTTVEFEIPRP